MALVFEDKSSQVGVEYTETTFGVLCWSGKCDGDFSYYPFSNVESFQYTGCDSVELVLKGGRTLDLTDASMVCVKTTNSVTAEYGRIYNE